MRLSPVLPAFCLTWCASIASAQTFTALSNTPSADLDTTLLLTNGDVMVHSTAKYPGTFSGDSTGWFELRPDAAGSYADGTWSNLASMNDPRNAFESAILPNGDVFVSGGEYSYNTQESSTAELYNPLANTWTRLPNPPGTLGDTASKVLADGSGVFLGDQVTPATYIYQIVTNSWVSGPTKIHNDLSDEESWALLPDGSIISLDIWNTAGSSNTSQRYVPGQNAWFPAGAVPGSLVNNADELGAALLLSTGKVLFLGSTGQTALYRPPPAGSTNPGFWSAGPAIPDGRNCDDAPAAVEPDGNVLIVAGDNFKAGAKLYEYNPTTNTMSAALVTPPGLTTLLNESPPELMCLLVLPTGQIMISTNESKTAYLYDPGQPALVAAQPLVTGVSGKNDGSFHLTGFAFNGIDEGSAYGDDLTNSTNYPLVRLTDAGGDVFYARSFNFSAMGVATTGVLDSADFLLPAGLPICQYDLSVIANGVESAPIDFDVVPEPSAGLLLICGAAIMNAEGQRRRGRKHREF